MEGARRVAAVERNNEGAHVMPIYKYTTLEDPLVTTDTRAVGINNAGQIVGEYLRSGAKAKGARAPYLTIYSAFPYDARSAPYIAKLHTCALGSRGWQRERAASKVMYVVETGNSI
jgi:hypothetical protein